MPAVIMSETSSHCLSNSATFRNKGELHILSHQIFKYCCAGKIYLRIYITRVSSDPIHFLQKNNPKTDILFFEDIFLAFLPLI